MKRKDLACQSSAASLPRSGVGAGAAWLGGLQSKMLHRAAATGGGSPLGPSLNRVSWHPVNKETVYLRWRCFAPYAKRKILVELSVMVHLDAPADACAWV